MRTQTLFLSILLLFPLTPIVSAETITVVEDEIAQSTLLTRAAPGATNTVEGSGFLSSNLLNFGFSNVGFGQDNGNLLSLDFSLTGIAGTNVELYEIELFDVGFVGGTIRNDLLSSNLLFADDVFELVLDFSGTTDLLAKVTIFTQDGLEPEEGFWNFTGGTYVGPPIVDVGGGVPSPIPLPAGAWLLLAGVGGLAALKRHHNQKATC